MFGYLTANADKLTDEEMIRYRSFYCGLCRSLGRHHGTGSRITLTYDMSFLVMLLSSLYQLDSPEIPGKCLVHPLKTSNYLQNEITDYAADMNLCLAYYKFLDNWADDNNLFSLCQAKLFRLEYNKIVAQYPRQSSVISSRLAELSEIERSGELNADIPANCFGTLMGEIFVWQEDTYSDDLRSFGKALGKFIYIMDASLDLKSDLKRKRYNPLVSRTSRDFRAVLNLLMADCVEKYNILPINSDKTIIENILYSGIWARYEAEDKKSKEKQKQ